MKYKILILEDNIEVLKYLQKGIKALEAKNRIFEITVISNEKDALNLDLSGNNYDVVLLDEYIEGGGSFHKIQFEKLKVERLISISSVASSNNQASLRGVKRSVLKDYARLDYFCQEVVKQIKEIISC